MPQGKQTKLSVKKRIIQAKMEDPEASLRDIEKTTGAKKDTIARTISKVPNLIATAGDNGEEIIQTISDIISKSTSIARKHLDELDAKESLDTKDVKLVTDIGETFFKRKQLLEGKPTEISQTKIELGDKSLKDLEEMRNGLL